jgi:branched-subunit amino acid transport protein
MSWVAVLVTSIGCLAVKTTGYLLPVSILDHPIVQRVAGLLPVTLLAALAVQQTVVHGRHLQLDARLPAVGVAIIAVRYRAPFLLVVVLAAATAAILRLLTG